MYWRKIFAGLAFGLCSVLLVRCTSSETSLVGPTTDKCQLSVKASPLYFGADGGAGTVTVSTSRDCSWSIASDAVWVSINGEHTGQGEAVVPYNVAANPVPSVRTGAIAVGLQQVQLSQAAAACRFELSRLSDTIGAGGGSLSVNVTTLTGCHWAATSNDAWIAISTGQSGAATGTVGLTVASNPGTQRVGRATIAGQSFLVTQSAAVAPLPVPTPPPPSPPPPAGGQAVSLKGEVQKVTGRCPNLTLTVSGRTVLTDHDTTFKGFSCNDVKAGRDVAVDGVTDSNGAVLATRVTKVG